MLTFMRTFPRRRWGSVDYGRRANLSVRYIRMRARVIMEVESAGYSREWKWIGKEQQEESRLGRTNCICPQSDTSLEGSVGILSLYGEWSISSASECEYESERTGRTPI